MAKVLLFHHALGRTSGIQAFADELRAAGHEVMVPDLFDGRTFATVEEGVAHAGELGNDALLAAGARHAEQLPPDVVYAGFSLGVMPAQRLAQQRAGASGALLYHSGVPLGFFGDRWPDGVPLQAHVMADDPWGDVDDLQELTAAAAGELYLYEGSAHLFTDGSSDQHEPEAARLVMERTLEFLDRVDR